MSRKQIGIRATYMRGGTSKGVFFTTDDLPASIRDDPVARDGVLLRVIGSPDPYGQQMDGMGSGSSSTSKVVLVSKSRRSDADVDYLFGQVAIDAPVIDWSGNCGNLSAAVGPFAISRGLVQPAGDGTFTVRIWQANLEKHILAHIPVQDGEVVEVGDFELDGVTFPAAEVVLEFIDPGAGGDSDGGGMFPTGNRLEVLRVPEVGTVEATLINAGNPTIFVEAAALGLTGAELQGAVNSDTRLLARFEAIRSHATVAMGLATSAQEATRRRPHTPKIAFVARPADYVASSGKPVSARDVDLLARILSMGKLHHAMTGTGAIAIAVAAAIPGTLLSRILGDTRRHLRFGHPSGSLAVGAEAEEVNGEWTVTKAAVSRSARRLMDGQVFVPSP